jgi:phosphoglycolate phosphatase
MQADALIFDLDGTLWDTCATCAKGWNRVLVRNAIRYREMVEADVRAICGRTHEDAIATAFPGLSQTDLDIVTRETMAEDNAIVAEEGGMLYPGVLEVIPRLAERMPLLIVSNCQAGYIEVFLKNSGLAPHFVDFECWGNTGRPKADNVAAVIARQRLAQPLFIGDTEGDREAALKNGLRFVHAAYGFGAVAGAHAVIGSLHDLEALVTAKSGS